MPSGEESLGSTPRVLMAVPSGEESLGSTLGVLMAEPSGEESLVSSPPVLMAVSSVEESLGSTLGVLTVMPCAHGIKNKSSVQHLFPRALVRVPFIPTFIYLCNCETLWFALEEW